MKPTRFSVHIGSSFKLTTTSITAAALVAGLSASFAFAEGADPSDTLAKLSVEWVKTRAEAVRAETEWNSQRELLDSTAKALAERARELEEARDLLKARTAKERGDLDRLEVENQQLAAQFSRLEVQLKSFDERLAKLRPLLPPKLAQGIELPLRSLASADLPTSERMAHTMTVLNRCAQFNRSITFGEDIIDLPGEAKPKLLQTVYWGLSHGYAYDKTAHKAWFGAPGPQGWTWTACTESVAAVQRLMRSFDEKAEPTFVAVPAAAGHAAGTTFTK
jgi:hypothetical protein